MKLNVIAVMFLLAASVCAQNTVRKDVIVNNVVVTNQYDSVNLEKISAVMPRISKSFCNAIQDGKSCNIPYPLNQGMNGVCCGGSCNFHSNTCSRRVDADFASEMMKLFCFNEPDNGRCNVPGEIVSIFPTDVSGVCCRGTCRFGISSCLNYCGDGICTDEERKGGSCQDDCGMSGSSGGNNMPLDAQSLEEMAMLSCLGAADEDKCNLPKDLTSNFDISGVCCSGKCNYRKTSCDKKTGPMPDLVISLLEVAPEQPSQTDKITVTVVVENTGSVPTDAPFWVEVSVRDESQSALKQDEFEVPESLPSGGEYKHELGDFFQFPRSGSFKIVASADQNNNYPHRSQLIEESNEANNEAAKTVFVRAPGDDRYCGDGVCEEMEKGSCFEDCKSVNGNSFCGDGVCEPSEEGSCSADCKNIMDDGLPIKEIIGLVVVALVILAVVVLFVIMRSGKKASQQASINAEATLEELIKQKEDVEQMTNLAKAKYHERKLDEESFREIARDNQMKVIQLEIRIKEMQGKK